MVFNNNRLSTPPPELSFEDGSHYDHYEDQAGVEYDRADILHDNTAESDRRVKILLKDAYDDKGPGMTFDG